MAIRFYLIEHTSCVCKLLFRAFAALKEFDSLLNIAHEHIEIVIVDVAALCDTLSIRNGGDNGVYHLAMPVRGNLGTLWAQFRHDLGTNVLWVR